MTLRLVGLAADVTCSPVLVCRHLCIGLPRVPGYPGNLLLPTATRVPEQKQITANVLNISAIFNRIYGIRISIYRRLTHHQ